MAKKSEGEPRIHRNFLRSQCRTAKRCWIETERKSRVFAGFEMEEGGHIPKKEGQF